MSICRHVLLRAYIPRLLPPPHVSRRLLTESLPVPLRLGHERRAAAHATPANAKEGAEPIKARVSTTAAPAAIIPSPRSPTLTKHALPRLPDAPLGSAETKAASTLTAENKILDAYVTHHENNRQLFKDYTGPKTQQIILLVAKRRRADAAALVLQDYLTAKPGDPEVFYSIVRYIPMGLLRKRHILYLLRYLRHTNRLVSIPAKDRIAIAETIVELPLSHAHDTELTVILTALLTQMLRDASRPAKSNAYRRLPRVVKVLYRLVCNLASFEQRPKALKAIRALVATNNLPPSAVPVTDLKSGDFELIVNSALIRSSLQWGWREHAVSMIKRTLEIDRKGKPGLTQLAAFVLENLLEEPSPMDLVSSAAILALLLERSPDCPIPAAVVHDFYNATEKLNNPELAEAVYSASRTARERGGQSLPPPRGNTLMWFVSHLVNRSKNVHTARELATQLVEDKVAIPLAHCGRIIALFAVQGFASQARALWERYADSADATERRYVVGHSAAMLRLVSLFTNLSKWAHSRAPAPGSAAAISEGVSVSKNVQEKDKTENDVDPRANLKSAPLGLASASASAEKVSAEPVLGNHDRMAPVIGRNSRTASSEPMHSDRAHDTIAEAPSHTHKLGTTLAHVALSPEPTRPQVSREDSSTGTSARIDKARAQPEAVVEDADLVRLTTSEFWAFAERVYDAFRETRQPLRRAHHFDVNALARASFILGRVTPGLAALRLLLARRSAPDLHDVNVALTLLAEHAPHAAARLVVGMARRGLRADAASFGTVIHHAAVHGDGALVGALIRRARAVGVPLSYKTLGTLLRRVFEEGGEGETREAACGRLRRVLALVDALVGVRQVPSPEMGRDCVVVALRADNARAAFGFWRLMVDGKAEWGDTAQVQLRRAIAGKVRREWGAGLLQGPGARAMLRMLGERVAAGATPTGEGGGRRDGG